MDTTSRRAERFRRLAPHLLCGALGMLFIAPLFDPAVQLYYRDTGRLYYPVKLFIAQELRAGRLALWDPLTECGVSILGQMTPALLHPATLLYLLLPFDAAFKANHVLGLLLGGLGAFRLARRLDAGPWASACAALAYGGCGYLVSMAGSNLPYALGAGTVPLAVDAVLGFVERRSAGRLAWAGAAVALIALAGEPQSMLIAGLIAGGWALCASAGARDAAHVLGLVAACGALALLFAAPAVLPALAELRRSDRASGVSASSSGSFANHPVRLAGLLVPRAFDDAPEAGPDPKSAWSTFSEFFAVESSAFADSIVIGAPALLLATAGFFASRKARLLVLGAALLALSSTGDALGIERLVFRLVPGASFFRFAEKLIAPASLLVALAAAVGAQSVLQGTRRAAGRFAAAAAALALLLLAGALAVGPRLSTTLVHLGKTHSETLALDFLAQLRAGLFDAAALAGIVAAAAAWRASRGREVAPLGALCCAASVFTSCGGLLYTAPIEYVRGPFDLARQLVAQAGPSPGRWRIFVDDKMLPGVRNTAGRLASTFAAGEGLFAQFNATAGIESMSPYFSAGDPAYAHGITEAPEKYFDLFGVRFVIESPYVFTEEQARIRGFRRIGLGYWVREYPTGPRAFVAGHVQRVTGIDEGAARVARPGFSIRSDAVVRGALAPERLEGSAGPAQLSRPAADRMHADAAGPGLLVVAEHFDPGWRASVNGRTVPVVEVDLAALGVALPPGPASIDLHFLPAGLLAGLALLCAAIGALSIATFVRGR